MRFTKMHGAGNDFVMINCMQEADLDFNALAEKVCDRHFGIGADGLIVALPSEQADIRYRIFNPDGSEPEMCGNGIRCFARFVYEEGILAQSVMKVETLAGIITPEIVFDAEGAIVGVKVDMGEPILERSLVPMNGPAGRVVAEELTVDGQTLAVTAVSMGNPHCITFVSEIDAAPVTTLGPKLEVHPAFPKKTNVEFVQVLNDREVIMRVWERGAGVTLACGTGACATLVACVLNGLTGREVTVRLLGGDLLIQWGDDNRLYMTGPAVNVFKGEYLG